MLLKLWGFYSSFQSKIPMPKTTTLVNTMKSNSKRYLTSANIQSGIGENSGFVSFLYSFVSSNYPDRKMLSRLENNFDLLKYVDDTLSSRKEYILSLISEYDDIPSLVESNEFGINYENYVFLNHNVNSPFYLSNQKEEFFNESFHNSPLKILDNESLEYTLDIENGKLIYHHLTPERLVNFIDLRTLLFRYYSYLIKTEEPDIMDFILNYVLIPAYYLNQNNYLLSILKETIRYKTTFNTNDVPNLDDIVLDVIDSKYGYLKNYIKPAFSEIYTKLSNIQNLNMDVTKFLISFPLINNLTISSYISHIGDLIPYDNENQYRWISIMKDFSSVDLLVRLYSILPNSSKKTRFFKTLRSVLNKYVRTKIWNTIANPVLQSYIQTEVITRLNTIVNEELSK